MIAPWMHGSVNIGDEVNVNWDLGELFGMGGGPNHEWWKGRVQFLPPANVVCEGYVFTGVCLSTEGVSQHALQVTWPTSSI